MNQTSGWQSGLSKIVLVGLLAVFVWIVAAAAPQKEQQQLQQQGSFLVVLAVWIAVYGVMLSAGYATGKARSVNFKDPKSDPYFQKYVANKATKSVAWDPKRGPNGELVELTAVWNYRFTCGIHAHVYDGLAPNKY